MTDCQWSRRQYRSEVRRHDIAFGVKCTGCDWCEPRRDLNQAASQWRPRNTCAWKTPHSDWERFPAFEPHTRLVHDFGANTRQGEA